jgi:hypothetical protein
MKKLISVLSLFVVLLITGCFEITQESTINNDGSGVYVSTTDMGAVLGMAKMMGGDSKEMKDLQGMKMDTVIALKTMKDSLNNLSDAEKAMLDNATLKVLLNADDEKFALAFSFPYSKPADVPLITSVLRKIKSKVLTDQMGKIFPGGDDEKAEGMGDMEGEMDSDVDDYYNSVYENGKLSKKLNAEKFANAENDKSLKTFQEMGALGTPMTIKTIINLPRPAKKAEGKGLKLSDDKKKVTIEGTIDDFFESPSQFEYVIEY